MPPLCTAGFGLATGNMHFFSGAMYLLLINSFFIALATFLIVKYLHFPVARYLNSVKRRRISRVIYVLAILVMIPSIMSFIKMYNEEIFKRSATDFINKTIKYEGAQIIKSNINPAQKKLDIYFIGEVVPQAQIENWQKELHSYPQFTDTQLKIYQSTDKTQEIEQSLSEKLKQQILDKLFKENKESIKNKDEQIKRLTDELIKLKQQQKQNSIPLQQIGLESKKLFPYIEQIGFGKLIETDFKSTDTIPTITVKWRKKLSRLYKKKEGEKLKNWLQTRLKLDTLKIINL
jgi:hypothetical protein